MNAEIQKGKARKADMQEQQGRQERLIFMSGRRRKRGQAGKAEEAKAT